MSANRVQRLFPETRTVFERLSQRREFEGSSPLDEVAWVQGMEPEELLEHLRWALAAAGRDVIEPDQASTDEDRLR